VLLPMSEELIDFSTWNRRMSQKRYNDFCVGQIRDTSVLWKLEIRIFYIFFGTFFCSKLRNLWVPLTLGGAQVSNLFIYIIISNFMYLEDKHKLYIFHLFFMWFFSPLNGLWQLLQLAFQRFPISVMVFELGSIAINLVLE
jgi:hypothetical protein